jgi:protein tyrosine/serine phosphatase
MIQVSENLWRGPRPSDLGDLQKRGIKRIVSLESGIYDLFHDGNLLCRQFPCEFQMAQYDLRSSDFAAPEDWAVYKFLSLMESPIPTFVHCLSGVDRTGFMCAVYRMRFQGWKYEDALAEWKKLGRHPWYFWWESALKKWRTS